MHLATLSKDLISLRYDIEFDDPPQDAGCNLQELNEFFLQYGFKTLSCRLSSMKGCGAA
jgi:hypothetical protein